MSDTFNSDGIDHLPEQTGGDLIHYPFLNLGNTANYLIERSYSQSLESKLAPVLGAAATAQDGGAGLDADPLYLIDETPLDPAAIQSARAEYNRLWAPEWGDITDYGSLTMALPDLRGLSYSTETLTYDEEKRRLRIKLADVSDHTFTFWTAGTWTYTGPVSTTESTALAYDANSVTALAALQAVDSVIYGVSQSTNPAVRPLGHYKITRRYYDATQANPTPTFDLSALSPVGAFHVETSAQVNTYEYTITVTGGALTGGSFDFITADTLVTVTLQWNDTAADMLTALQAADSQFEAVDIDTSGSNQTIKIYSVQRLYNAEGNGHYSNEISYKAGFDISSLTHSGSGISDAAADVAGTEELIYVYPTLATVSKTAHKLITGDVIDCSTTELSVTRIDADTFSINFASWAEAETNIDTYAPVYYWFVRTKPVPARFVYEFYLPGVTAGITTADDIASVDVIDHDYALLQSIVDQVGEVTLEVSSIDHIYPGIYQRVLTKIYLADLYD